MCIEADCKIPALLIKDKALKSATQHKHNTCVKVWCIKGNYKL